MENKGRRNQVFSSGKEGTGAGANEESLKRAREVAANDATMRESGEDHAAATQRAAESTEAAQISVEAGLRRYERQQTPGAADSGDRDHSDDSLAHEADPDEPDTMKDNQLGHGGVQVQLEQPSLAADLVNELNPEQALNLTDDDIEGLRKLLTEHVSHSGNRRVCPTDPNLCVLSLELASE